MKRSLLVALLSSLVVTGAVAHDWKNGTLVESADERLTSGGGGPIAIARSGGGDDYATAAAIAANRPRTVTERGFVIQGGGYVYMVKCRVGRHPPNVTIRGPIKYALEKGKFYIQDEDGREFSMVLMKKSLSSPASP